MISPSRWLAESQEDIDTKQYRLSSSFNIVSSYVSDQGCPYCGEEDWFEFYRASGYEMHWSDSDINCKNEGCPFGLGPWTTSMTLKQHYEYLQKRAAKWFEYMDKERVEALRNAYRRTGQVALYIKHHRDQ